jgi:hypothetical protein
MKPLNLKYQGGVALILLMLGLMGIGGLLFVGYSQGLLKQVELSKSEHNTRVLNEAKQALLQFAYNYPVLSTPSIGPGRLPNADTDNDGIPDGGSTFGRLPWAQANLNLYDIRDADGERLWYAVSSSFRPQTLTPPGINSDTSGTITLRDQGGKIIYDGSNPGSLTQYGVAAVIIAPGAVTARNGVSQDRSVANVNDPIHYLDLVVGTENNATVANGTTDGFILGPVDALSTDAVNDQFIVITAEEVIAMAEKATLQAYRTAINDYRSYCDGEIPDGATTEALCLAAPTPGTWTLGPYPWLYNYTGVPDVAGLSSYYPVNAVWATELATNLDNFGRIPSIFGDYFTEPGSQPFESKLSGSITLDNSLTSTVGGVDFFGGPTLDFQIANKLTDVQFVDLADVVGDDGRLTGTMTVPEIFTWEVYFYEYDHDEPYNNGWSVCAAGADELSDCNHDSALNPTPGVANDLRLDIIHVTITLDLTGVVNFDMDYTIPPVIAPPVAATATSHATITGTYAGADIISRPSLTATWERAEHYHEGDTTIVADWSGTWNAADMENFGNGPLSLEMRFYPELPGWVFDNDWHNSVMMAYAANYRPDVLLACTEGTDCIQINGLAGNNDNKVSILTLAGQDNWDDDTDSNFINDLPTIFDAENADILDIDGTEYLFDRREPGGNDKILVIEEL